MMYRAWVTFLVLLSVFSRALAGVQLGALPTVSEPRIVVPSAGLPHEVDLANSNNCVSIVDFEGRLFMAWRSAPMHFASKKTKLFVVSSGDEGTTWQLERTFEFGRDAREPHFAVVDGGESGSKRLMFTFFTAGTNPTAFQPHRLYRSFRSRGGAWTDAEAFGSDGEIIWQMVTGPDGALYATSYRGNHYTVTSRPQVSLFLNKTMDGITWRPLGGSSTESVYEGGASETGIAFDKKGNLWAVLRNEDGDDSGWGSRVAFAEAGSYGTWKFFPEDRSDPWIYESPRLFVHEDDVYMVARRDINGPYDRAAQWLPWEVRHNYNLVSYSTRAHTTALYRINQESKQVEWLLDLPGCGDTAFPSIIKRGKNKYLVANYSSPFQHAGWSWIRGQTSSEGTQIHFVTITFEDGGPAARAIV